MLATALGHENDKLTDFNYANFSPAKATFLGKTHCLTFTIFK